MTMIARHLRMNASSKSNFGHLATYLMESQGSSQRVLSVDITNCDGNDVDLAVIEIMATQAQNIRARGDKTYHLVVSFRDKPSPETIKEVENRLCADLGFDGHQRISVLHGDTDNVHLHIAINKINPENLTMHEPFHDHTKLAKACISLEQELRIAQDNHEFRTTARPSAAQNMEAAGDRESLIGWIQRTCCKELLSAESWAEIHDILAKNNLSIKPRGNGFVISSGAITVKASSVDRRLSKAALEKRLGAFIISRSHAEHLDTYRVRPMPHNSHKESRERLWNTYLSMTSEQEKMRQLELQKLRKARDEELRAINFQFRNAIIKHFVSGALFKRVLYAMERAERKRKMKKIKAAYAEKRKALYRATKKITWRDWLNEEAKRGNNEALAVIRARGAVRASANTITPDSQKAFAQPDKITHRGTRIFTDGLREQSGSFHLPGNAGDSVLLAALQRSKDSGISLAGDQNFIARILTLAKEHGLHPRFMQQAIADKWRKLTMPTPQPQQHIYYRRGR